MPRVEIIPINWETSEEQAQGNGTPTVDVCISCHAHMIATAAEYVGDMPGSLSEFDDEDRLGEMQVEHPPYAQCDYHCVICNKFLNDEDD